MSFRHAEPVPVAPFLEWVDERLGQLEPIVESPLAAVLLELGWDQDAGARRLLRWRSDLTTGLVERADVEDALHRAGVAWHDVYDADEHDTIDGWCRRCRETITAGADRLCPWCETPIGKRPRRRGGKPAGVYGKLTDDQLRTAYRLHVELGLSARELGRRLWQQHGYTSDKSCTMALCSGWKRLELPARNRVAATVAAATTHGLRPRTGPLPGYNELRRKRRHAAKPPRRCAGVRTQPPRKGQPCSRPPMDGSDYCFNHAPERRAELEEQLAEMRARVVA